jgi:hypothetical protein
VVAGGDKNRLIFEPWVIFYPIFLQLSNIEKGVGSKYTLVIV